VAEIEATEALEGCTSGLLVLPLTCTSTLSNHTYSYPCGGRSLLAVRDELAAEFEAGGARAAAAEREVVKTALMILMALADLHGALSVLSAAWWLGRRLVGRRGGGLQGTRTSLTPDTPPC
jgi:hypothetical protein